jgi:hypothetical protein
MHRKYKIKKGNKENKVKSKEEKLSMKKRTRIKN